jgi:hypothetical protein
MCQAIAILLEADAEFVCAMEDVLDLYHRSYDENRHLVCLDVASKQLIGAVIEPIPAEPGQPERCDHEYAIAASPPNHLPSLSFLRSQKRSSLPRV